MTAACATASTTAPRKARSQSAPRPPPAPLGHAGASRTLVLQWSRCCGHTKRTCASRSAVTRSTAAASRWSLFRTTEFRWWCAHPCVCRSPSGLCCATRPPTRPPPRVQLRFQFAPLPDAVIDELAGRGQRVALHNAAVAASLTPPIFTSTRLDVLTVGNVRKVVSCGDDVCVADEVRVSGAPALPTTCDRDCPLEAGATCPAPGTNEAGDSSTVRACLCNAALLAHECAFHEERVHAALRRQRPLHDRFDDVRVQRTLHGRGVSVLRAGRAARGRRVCPKHRRPRCNSRCLVHALVDMDSGRDSCGAAGSGSCAVGLQAEAGRCCRAAECPAGSEHGPHAQSRSRQRRSLTGEVMGSRVAAGGEGRQGIRRRMQLRPNNAGAAQSCLHCSVRR